MPTRQQAMLIAAATHVEAARRAAGSRADFRTAYGGLCHSFPIYIRTSGLCQALAFIESKAGDGDARKEAHALFLNQVAENLGYEGGGLPSRKVATDDVVTYIRKTRLILQRAVFYKRFAVSILKVESSEEP